MSLQKNNGIKKILSFSLIPILLFLTVSCAKTSGSLVIWTDNAELASYAELFNATQTDIRAVVLYKENPYGTLPPAKDEKKPDLIIGASNRDNKACQYLLPLDYLFQEQNLSKSDFYAPLTDMGFSGDKQYMLPISFNMPAVVFSTDSAPLIPDPYSLSLDEIRDTAASFNIQNDSGVYTQMGFAPVWDSEFLYTAAKLKGISFQDYKGSVIWDKLALNATVNYLKNWTADCNTSTTAEQDYQFKYLNIPNLKWITQGDSLFTYTTSNELFKKAPEKLQSLDYRWLQQDEKTPVEDVVVFIGLYKDSHKKREGEAFILWLLNTDNQKKILEWTSDLNLISDSFGICGGFSSLKPVNEQVFPIFYPMLLGNLPQESELTIPNALPDKWNSIKEQVILPYLIEATDTTTEGNPQSLEDRLTAWNKQYF